MKCYNQFIRTWTTNSLFLRCKTNICLAHNLTWPPSFIVYDNASHLNFYLIQAFELRSDIDPFNPKIATITYGIEITKIGIGKIEMDIKFDSIDT